MPTNRMSSKLRESSSYQSSEELEIYPFAAAATSLVVGIGIGMAVAMLTTSPPRQRNIAERVGHQILEGLRSISPQSWIS